MAFLLVISFLCIYIPQEINAKSNEEDTKEKLYIVGYTKEKKKPKVNKKSKQKYGKIIKEYKYINAVLMKTTKEKIKKLKKDDKQISVQESPIISLLSQKEGWQHEPTAVNTSQMWDMGATGEGVTVAVIDSGVKTDHEDFLENQITAYDIGERVNSNSWVEVTGDEAFGMGHGTHVAGIIAANDNDKGIIGIAPKAKIVSYRIEDDDEIDSPDDEDTVDDELESGHILSAYEDILARARDNDPANDIDIINMSYGHTIENPAENDFSDELINQLYDAGVIMVGAASNDGNTSFSFPASYNNVISVGNVEKITPGNYKLNDDSNRNDRVDFVAPGTDILSTWIENDYDDGLIIPDKIPYHFDTGTSMAAPIVSGLIALYKDTYGDLSLEEIEEILRQGAKDLGDTGKDDLYGYGLVSAKEAEFPVEIDNKFTIKSSETEKNFFKFYSDVESTYNEQINRIAREDVAHKSRQFMERRKTTF